MTAWEGANLLSLLLWFPLSQVFFCYHYSLLKMSRKKVKAGYAIVYPVRYSPLGQSVIHRIHTSLPFCWQILTCLASEGKNETKWGLWKNGTKHDKNLKMTQTDNSLQWSSKFRRTLLKSVMPNALGNLFPSECYSKHRTLTWLLVSYVVVSLDRPFIEHGMSNVFALAF